MNGKTERLKPAETFAEILQPVEPGVFFRDYYDRKPLHIQGGPDKFAWLMSWRKLQSLLDMTAVWSSASLQLALDTVMVPPAKYCRGVQGRDGHAILQPDASRVMQLLREGASLVANDIDTLAPELASVAAILENAVNGKAQANLYCSWRERQGFGSHFDTHDVYAIHVAGEKRWRMYETRLDNPIAHPKFKSFGQEWHDRNRGAVAQEVVMRPGDLLYIPRGQYHDAVATSDGTIHIAFGVTHVIGMDVLEVLTALAVDDNAFRRNMPQPAAGDDAIGQWLRDLGDRLAAIARDPGTARAMGDYQSRFRYPRGGFALPVKRSDRRFRITAEGLRVEKRNGKWALAGAKGAAPVPPGLDEPVRWIIKRSAFTEKELASAFPDLEAPAIAGLLEALARMKVITSN